MKKLFLLDGMALAYRAHFALIRSPIYNSKGMNTSAIFGFTATLIDLIKKQQPTHLAIAFDTLRQLNATDCIQNIRQIEMRCPKTYL